MSGGFSVDLGALEGAAGGVRELVTTLAEINGWGGLGQSLASNGRGLQDAAMSAAPRVGAETGRLGGALMVFGRAWESGLANLVEDGQAAAEALTTTAAEYRARDQEAAGHIERAVTKTQ